MVEIGDLAQPVAQVYGLDVDAVRRTRDRDIIVVRYVGDGRLIQERAAEAGLSLRRLPVLVRETSAWLTTGWATHETHAVTDRAHEREGMTR